MSYLPNANSTYMLLLRSRSKGLVVLETFIYTSIAAIAFMGNSLVIWIVYKNRTLRTIPNYFVITLAFSDIGMALLGAPWSIVVLAKGKWPFSFAACQLQGFFVIWFAVASLQTLTIMAFNRYCCIVKPVLYRRIFSKYRTRLYIISAYLVSSFSPLPYVIGGNVFVFQPGKFFCYQKSIAAYTLPLMLIYIGTPTFIIVLCYLKVFLAIRHHRQNILKPISTETRTKLERITTEDIRITKTLFATVVGFLLCWVPVILIEMIDLGIGQVGLPRQVYMMFTICGLSSSAINPIIYGVMNKTFRREFRNMCLCARSDRVIAVEPIASIYWNPAGGLPTFSRKYHSAKPNANNTAL